MANSTTEVKKLKKPSFTITRVGYKFVLQFYKLDDYAEKIHITREVFEKGDKNDKKKWDATKADKKTTEIKASKTSWIYTMNKEKYYPFVSDTKSGTPAESDLDQIVDHIKFTVWITREKGTKKSGSTTIVTKSNLTSEKVTKSYSFSKSVNPAVAMSYTQDGNVLSYVVDVNDDYSIDSSSKKVATRAWYYASKKVKGSKGEPVKIEGHTGAWFNKDGVKSFTKTISKDISREKSAMYIINAYSAGPGGKSDWKSSYHVFGIPKTPKKPVVTRSGISKINSLARNIYKVDFTIDQDKSKFKFLDGTKNVFWKPVDNVTIQYKDFDRYPESSLDTATDSWNNAKENLAPYIKTINTDDIGPVAADSVRYFRIKVEHDGNVNYSYISDAVEFGKPSSVNGLAMETVTVSGKSALKFTWTEPTIKLYKNGSTNTRIVIYKNSIKGNPIGTVYYGSAAWSTCTFVYDGITDSELGKAIKFYFIVKVGSDKDGNSSVAESVGSIILPGKCTEVKGTKLSTNDAIELTWTNSSSQDTVFDGIEIAWSTLSSPWETNKQPDSITFDNASMTKVTIYGLSEGETYYFWVRRYEVKGGSTVYGPWSDVSDAIYLADAPSTPVLTLSRDWVKPDGNFVAQWIYYGNSTQTAAQVDIISKELDSLDQAKEDGRLIKNILDLSVEELDPDIGVEYTGVVKTSFELTDDIVQQPIFIKIHYSYNEDLPDDYFEFNVSEIYNEYKEKGNMSSAHILYLQKYSTFPNRIWVGIYFTYDDFTYDEHVTTAIDGLILSDTSQWCNLGSVDGDEDRLDIDLSKTGLSLLTGEYSVRVRVSNEVSTVESEPIYISIADTPTSELDSTSIQEYIYESVDDETGETVTSKTYALTSMPLNILATGNGDLDLYLYCTDTFDINAPYKSKTMYAGDCIWTSSVESGIYDIENVKFEDGQKYRLQLECTEPNSLLKAETRYIDFEVHWAHQAVAPIDSTVIFNDEGNVELVPVKPEGALDTDVCDIYRSTADDRYLVAEDVKWGQTVIDKLPTFGHIFDNAYCFCTKTSEGDKAWADISYELDGSGVIINYGEERVELPWNVTLDDNRSKNGEVRAHLGGTKAYYGQPHITRTVSISSQVVKELNEEIVNKLYDLSRYSGLCYVRSSNGLGYPATVDVSINREYNNQIVSISISVTEADQNGEYLGEIIES